MSAPTTRATRREALAGHAQPEDWRHRAGCRSVDPEIFFPTAVRGREFERQVSIAKAVCAGCPVRAECLSWALTRLPVGIAGGLTEHERRGELARRRGERRRRVPRRPVGGSREEVAAAGRAALAAGGSVHEVAAEFLVTVRTAQRWASEVHMSAASTPSGDAGEGR